MRSACVLLLLVGLLGCAALPWPGARREPAGPAEGGWLDLRGVVHVHTRGSHDSPGTVDQVVAAARSAGVSWVALTEHTRPGVVPPAQRRDGVTVIPGLEIGLAGGSILALGVDGTPPRTRDPEELVGWVRAQGGLAFVAHLERSRLAAPDAYARAAPDGIEILNLHAAALERRVGMSARMLFLPASFAFRSLLTGTPSNLDRWSRLRSAHAIVAGVDAHARFRVLGPLGGNVDRYRDAFRALTTHVWVRDPGMPAILEALREGRSYVACEGLAAVDRFAFHAEDGGYRLEAPRPARLALVCDGREATSVVARSAHLRPPVDARWCRGEAWLGKDLWIVTSEQPVAEEPGS